MFLLSTDNFRDYAASCAGLADERWSARLLGGGVSNIVILAEGASGRRLVFKQALGQLRVKEEWLADRARIHREAASMRALAPLLPAGAAPAVVYEDQNEFIYAMEAAPPDAVDWKTRLLGDGQLNETTVREVAAILAALVRGTAGQARWQGEFGDQHCFDQLRLDPYYRFTAARHPALRDAFDEAIALARTPRAMVHGDFSPKNILTAPGRPAMLIDFEVIHYGDPGFDAAFLLNHLLLKEAHGIEGMREFARLFWRELRAGLPDTEWLEATTIRHLGCLHLARVDGKSPAEYLTGAEQVEVRKRAIAMIAAPPGTIEEWLSQ